MGSVSVDWLDSSSFLATLPHAHTRRYFGAAKDLPGVRELFQTEAPEGPRKTRGDLFHHVDAGECREMCVCVCVCE
jgi:hypothetical protein